MHILGCALFKMNYQITAVNSSASDEPEPLPILQDNYSSSHRQSATFAAASGTNEERMLVHGFKQGTRVLVSCQA